MTRLPLALLTLLLATSLSAQLTVLAEKPVTAPVIGASNLVAPYDGFDIVDVASAGDQLLVVWSERRSDLSSDIFAARLDRAGRLLDTNAILVATGPSEDYGPRVIPRGSRFLVAWSQADAGGVRTRAAHIDATGRVLEPGGVVVTEGRLHSIVDTGSTLMIAVQRPVPQGALPRIAIGTVSPALTFTQTADIGAAFSPQLALYGGGVIAVWLHFDAGAQQVSVERQQFDRGGRRIGGVDPFGELGILPGPFPTLTAGTSGGDAVIAAAGQDVLRVARLYEDGTARLATGLTSPTGQNFVTTVGGPGLDVLAVVNGILTLYRFDSGNDALSSTQRPAPLALWGRLVPHDGRSFVAFVNTPSPGVANVHTGFLPFGDTTLISRSAESHRAPALATDGTSVLAVWSEDRGTQYDAILGRRLDRTGTPIGNAFVIADGTYPTGPPSVSFDGSNYVVVWHEVRRPSAELHTTVMSRRVTPAGVPIDEVQISPNAFVHALPATASDGRNVLITWTDGAANDPELRAAVLPPNRYITPPSIVLPALYSPAAVWNGESYLIVAKNDGPAIRAMVVSREGALVSSIDATIPPADLDDRDPAIAWNGSVHLLAYERGGALYGTLLRRDGTRASADFPIGATGTNPQLTWDGTSFVMTWEGGGAYRDLFASRLNISGNTIGSPALVSIDPLTNESDASLLGLGGGKTLVAYQRLTLEATAVHRVFTRVLGLPGRQRAVRH